MPLLMLILLGLTLVSTPLSAQRARRGCEKTPVDSSVAGAPLYRACHVDQAARPAGRQPQPAFVPQGSEIRDGACFRASFEFVVSAVGVPEVATITQLSSTSARYAAAAQAVIPQMRYRPAILDGQPVRQVVQLRMNGGTVRATTRQSIGSGVGGMRVARC